VLVSSSPVNKRYKAQQGRRSLGAVSKDIALRGNYPARACII
jgi:hypothetical protein